MNDMLAVLAGTRKPGGVVSSRANQSPLSFVGLAIVIGGTVLFSVFGLTAMRLISSLSHVLNADPETTMRYVWYNSEIVLAITIFLTAVSCSSCIYHWHFYFQWERGADISEQRVVRALGGAGILSIYVSLVWAVLVLGAMVGGETLAQAVLTAQSQAFNVHDELLSMVEENAVRAGLGPPEVALAVGTAIAEYDMTIFAENQRVRTAKSLFVQGGLKNLSNTLGLSEAEFQRLAAAEVKNKCARQCLDLSLVPLVGSEACICDVEVLSRLAQLCDSAKEAFDRSIIGVVLLAVGLGILLVRTSFWFGITKYSKLPSTVPVHGIVIN